MSFRSRFAEFRSLRTDPSHIANLASAIVLTFLAWHGASLLRQAMLKRIDISTYPWTTIFFHPLDASLLNYLICALVLFLWAVVCYGGCVRRFLPPDADSLEEGRTMLIALMSGLVLLLLLLLRFLITERGFIAALLYLALGILFIGLLRAHRKRASVRVLMLLYTLSSGILLRLYTWERRRLFAILPFLILFAVASRFPERIRRIPVRRILMAASWILLLLLAAEPFRRIQGPTFLVNEYARMFDDTKLDGNYIDNRVYLESAYQKGHFPKELERFININMLPYAIQNMSRGQINHIEHVLCPINEFVCGKPLKDIYFQYGLGNTFLLKWTMEIFGGVSIENYYKCYIYYIIYFIAFLALLYFLFKDIVYIILGFLIFAIAFFSYGYIGFLNAPGNLPTLHGCDVPVLFLLACYFRREHKPGYLLLASFFCAIGILLNPFYGLMLTVALLAAILLGWAEGRRGGLRPAFLAGATVLPMVALVLLNRICAGEKACLHNVFWKFLCGWFAWKPNPLVVVFILGYLAVAYGLLFRIRDERCWMKYIWIFIFIYVQGLFCYYFWSGLENHLPMIMPFLGLHVLMSIFLIQGMSWADRSGLRRRIDVGLGFMIPLLILLCVVARQRFYDERFGVTLIYRQHRVYDWHFAGANLVSTMDPAPIGESLSLMQKYRERDSSAICILSKYDALLTLLNRQRSLMPIFDLSWYLISEREHEAAIEVLNAGESEYLFVDNDIERDRNDPWASFASAAWKEIPKYQKSFFQSQANEAQARLGRYQRLKAVFNQVRCQYVKIDEDGLLSVYRRK
jgi:hypothetical protein